MPNAKYAEIVLPVPVDHPFTYAVPEALRERAVLGMRAVVPMRERVETGYIVGFAGETDLEKVRFILDLPDEQPVFSPHMLELCRWMSEYYCCSWGEALQCAVPAGMRIGSKMRYRLALDQLGPGRFTERQRKVIAEVHRRGPLTEGQLAASIGRAALSNTLQSLTRRGLLIAEPVIGEGAVSIQTETWVILREDRVLSTDALGALQRRAPKQAAVYLDLLHGSPERAATELYAKHAVTAAILQTLEAKALIRREEREFYRRPAQDAGQHAAGKHTLNAEQDAAYQAIVETAGHRRFQTFLLQGITGSGKTEVYLQAIERILAMGRDAIILVPEISLTPQTVGRFYARFHEAIAVLHSGLGTGERYDEWRRAQRGEVRIVVGARSAVFAPLPDVGIIVVDEEHDHSYKQGDAPRYHARDVAIMRAKMNHGVCVLGSATPSLESFHNSCIGKSERLELRSRATAASLPKVTLIDMRVETQETKGEVLLSRTLESAIQLRLDAGEQVILLLNRRGYAPFVMCPQCGWVAPCPNCQVTLTYHSAGAKLRCHYCNAQRPKPEVCDECHFNPLLYLGAGTQKIEDYLQRAFPGARIERMDADTTAGKGGHAKILGRFAAGQIDILVGTQMLAKGHDYPGVTLVGVVNADTGLALPDFRAAEQTFQLLTQVAGRAGRGGRPGQVFVQTYRPRHYAVAAAAQHDYGAFFAKEIEYRRGAGYPPFRRLAHFAIEAADPAVAERQAVLLSRLVREQIKALELNGIEVLGPAPAAIRRMNKIYRWQLAALCRSAQRLNTLIRAAREAYEAAAKTGQASLKIDLDPQGMF